MRRIFTTLAIFFGVFLLLSLASAVVSQAVIKVVKNDDNTEKCSETFEGINLCTQSVPIQIQSGDPVKIQLSWTNSATEYRNITRPGSFSRVIRNAQDEAIPRREPADYKALRTETTTKEQANQIFRGGSDRGMNLEPGESKVVQIQLGEYDLRRAGRYFVTIRKVIASQESGAELTFVLNNIEVDVN